MGRERIGVVIARELGLHRLEQRASPLGRRCGQIRIGERRQPAIAVDTGAVRIAGQDSRSRRCPLSPCGRSSANPRRRCRGSGRPSPRSRRAASARTSCSRCACGRCRRDGPATAVFMLRMMPSLSTILSHLRQILADLHAVDVRLDQPETARRSGRPGIVSKVSIWLAAAVHPQENAAFCRRGRLLGDRLRSGDRPSCSRRGRGRWRGGWADERSHNSGRSIGGSDGIAKGRNNFLRHLAGWRARAYGFFGDPGTRGLVPGLGRNLND